MMKGSLFEQDRCKPTRKDQFLSSHEEDERMIEINDKKYCFSRERNYNMDELKKK